MMLLLLIEAIVMSIPFLFCCLVIKNSPNKSRKQELTDVVIFLMLFKIFFSYIQMV
jgi:hypothetical protein